MDKGVGGVGGSSMALVHIEDAPIDGLTLGFKELGYHCP
jgi:hypothetical protein